jgi:hypothetical protein
VTEARANPGPAARALVALFSGKDDEQAFAGAVILADALHALPHIEALLRGLAQKR